MICRFFERKSVLSSYDQISINLLLFMSHTFLNECPCIEIDLCMLRLIPRSKIVSSWRTLFSGTPGTPFYNFLMDLDLTWIESYYLGETYLSEKLTENSRNMRPVFNFDPFSFEIPIYSKSTYKSNDKSTFLENIVK